MRNSGGRPRHYLFLQWLLFLVSLLFVIWLAWEYGFLRFVFLNDPTRISVVISLIFIAGSVHCALRVWYLSAQLNEVLQISQEGKNAKISTLNGLLILDGKMMNDSLASRFFIDILKINLQSQNQYERQTFPQLIDVLVEETGGQHETGWFFVHLLVKLGLLGTVVGFVLMLGSFADINSIEFADLQDMIGRMAVGMGVALTTTLVGLVSSMLLGFQYLMLDRAADHLVSSSVHFANVHLNNNVEEATTDGHRATAAQG